MKVINIHKRVLNQPKEQIAELLETLATKNDKVLATDKWYPMILDKGLIAGSKGGHGPIRYTVQAYNPGKFVQFKFTKPNGFNGIHRFEIEGLEKNQTEIKHSIKMTTSGSGTLVWLFAIRWLHDAFMEDAFDKVENTFLKEKKKTEWNFWVKVLRKAFKPRRKKTSNKQ